MQCGRTNVVQQTDTSITQEKFVSATNNKYFGEYTHAVRDYFYSDIYILTKRLSQVTFIFI